MPSTSHSTGSQLAPPPAASPRIAASCTFVRRDVVTNGAWIGVYGGQGYAIFGLGGAPDVIPPGLALATGGAVNYSAWFGARVGSYDTRLLQVPGQPDTSGAATYFANYPDTETITVTFTDGLLHSVAFYILDADQPPAGRKGTVTTYDATNPASLILIDGPRDIGDFGSTGVYMVYDVSGAIQFAFTCTAGPNVTVCGLFIDPPGPAPTTTGMFLYRDNWRNAYLWPETFGSQGYGIFQLNGVADKLPPNSTVAYVGGNVANPWIAVASFSDPRYVGVPNAYEQSGLSVYYTGSGTTGVTESISFNFADGLEHAVAIYGVALDDMGVRQRIELYDISNPGTPALLDGPREFGDQYKTGIYMVYNVSGHVRFDISTTQVTNNAVLSAWFVDPPRTIRVRYHGTDSWLLPFTPFVQRDNWRNASTWMATYGLQGYSIFGLGVDVATPDVMPPGCTMASHGDIALAQPWVPVSHNSSDGRLLQIPGHPGYTGVATMYTGGTEALAFNLDDGLAHSIALYFLDLNGGRTGNVVLYDMTNPGNPIQLDAREIGDYATTGVYLVYNVQGHVQFNINCEVSGSNTTLCGYFFDRPRSVGSRMHATDCQLGPRPQFVARDNWRNASTWMATYGKQGYGIIQFAGTPDVLPANCTVAYNRGAYQTNWVDPGSYTDPRYLQVPGQPGVTGAGVYWAPGSDMDYTFNLGDGLVHSIAIYFLDAWYDNRAGTIALYDVTNPASPVLLDGPRDVGNHATTGVYFVYNVVGAVQFLISNTGGGGGSGGTGVTTSGWFMDRPRLVVGRTHRTGSFVGPRMGFVQRDNWRNASTWMATYGAQGYALLGLGGVPDVMPAGVAATGYGDNTISWVPVGNYNDPRYIQVPGQPGVTGVYYCYSSNTVSIVIDTRGTSDAHSVAIYFVDAYYEHRNSNYALYDVSVPGNPVLLDGPRAIGDTTVTGVYMVYNVRGLVQVNIGLIAGGNSGYAALFFDRPRFVGGRAHGADSFLAAPSPVFVQKDSWSNGNWIGTYGALGYTLFGAAGIADNIPPGVTLAAFAGGEIVNWSPPYPNPDERVPQVPGQPGIRASSVYYIGNNSQLGVHVFTLDGNPYSVALYSWDGGDEGRVQSWMVYDITSGSGVVLEDPRDEGDITARGAYMVYNIPAGRQIQFNLLHSRPDGYGTAVVSAIFLDRPRSVGTRYHGTSSYIAPTPGLLQRDNWRNASTWMSTYGFQGYGVFQLAGVPDVLPPGGSISYFGGGQFYPWGNPAGVYTDPRLLQVPGQPGNTSAAVFTSQGTFGFLLDPGDGAAHSLSVYAFDYEYAGRRESMGAYNMNVGVVPIDGARDIGDFTTTGVYMTYNFVGKIQVNIDWDPTSATNGVISGWFLDRPRTIGTRTHGTNSQLAPVRGFLQRDSWRNGAWIGEYGAQGYSLLTLNNQADIVPSGCTVAYSAGNWLVPWVTPGVYTDPRYIQVPGMPGYTGVGTFYTDIAYGATTSVTFNFDDGLAHSVALYLLDLNLANRLSTITLSDVTNPGSPVVLDPAHNVGDYGTTGVYMVYNVSGRVQFLLTNTNSAGHSSANTTLCAWYVDRPKSLATRSHGTDCSVAPTARFLQADNWRDASTWMATYGLQGYSILSLAGIPDVLPSGFSVGAYNGNPVNPWVPAANNYGDPRYLQIPSQPGYTGVAGYYTLNTDWIVFNLDGQPHSLAIYFLDVDRLGRQGTIAAYDVTDPNNTVTIDPGQTIGDNATHGRYMVYNVTARAVQFNITWTSGSSNIAFAGWFIDRAKSIGGQVHGTSSFLADTRLISRWKLDEAGTSQTAVDSGPAGANAVDVTGGSTASTAAPTSFANPGGRHFQGATFLQNTSQAPAHNLTTNFTVAAWIRIPGLSSNTPFVSHQNSPSTGGWGLLTDASVMPIFQAGKAGGATKVTADAALATGVWTHLTGVVYATSSRIFVGGRMQSGVNANVPDPSPSYPTRLGQGGQGTGEPAVRDAPGTQASYGIMLLGDLDDVRIYSLALSNDQIQSLAGGNEPFLVTPATRTHTTSTRVTSLISWYKFDETGTGTTAIDSGGAGLNATDPRGATGTVPSSIVPIVPARLPFSVNARNFAGVNYLTTATPAAAHGFSSKFTVSIWARFSGSTFNQPMINHQVATLNRGWGMQTDSTGRLYTTQPFSGVDGGLQTDAGSGTITTGVWIHFCMAVGTSRFTYTNARKNAFSAGTGTTSADLPTQFGQDFSDAATIRLGGDLDDARIYAGQLTDDQVYSLYGGNDPLTAVATIRTHTTDGEKYKGVTKTHTTDNLRSTPVIRSHSADSKLYGSLTRAHATNAVLHGTVSRAHSGDTLVLEARLVSWWRLDEANLGDTAIDSGWAGANAVNANGAANIGPSTTPPIAAPTHFVNPHGRSFTGAPNARLDAGTQAAHAMADNFTLAAWVRQTLLDHEQVILTRWDDISEGWSVYTSPGNTGPVFWSGSASGTSGEAQADQQLMLGVWTHITGLKRAGTMYIYINGGRQSGSASSTWTPTPCDTIIGGWAPGWDGGDWIGDLDDVRIYNVALSNDQIQSLAGGNEPFQVTPATRAHGTDARLRGTAVPTHGTSTNVIGALVGWWKLDEPGAGDAAIDYSPLGANAINSGAAVGSSTIAPIAAPTNFFNPHGRYFSGAISANLSAGVQAEYGMADNFTVAAWVRLPAIGSDAVIVGHINTAFTDGWALYAGSATSQLRFLTAGSGSYPNVPADHMSPLGSWVHAVGMVRSGVQYLYVNGGRQSTSVTSTLNATPGDMTTIGAWTDTNGTNWIGDIDDVRLYRVALTDDQIQSLAGGNEPFQVTPATRSHGTSTNTVGSLVGWYKLDEAGVGATAIDSSPVGADAVDIGGTIGPSTLAPVAAPTHFPNPHGRYFSGAGYADVSLNAGVQATQGMVDNFTVSIWVRAAAADAQRTMISRYDGVGGSGWTFYTYTEADYIKAAFTSTAVGGAWSGLNSDQPLPLGVWTHIAGVSRAGMRYFYVGGARQSETDNFVMTPADTPVMIGAWSPIHNWINWCGDLDDARLYRVPLTDDQIQSLAGGNEPFLVTPATRSHGTDSLLQAGGAKPHGTDSYLPTPVTWTFTTSAYLTIGPVTTRSRSQRVGTRTLAFGD